MPHGAIPFPFGKCRICHDKATGVHYGVATCEGCKGFYKRSIPKGEKYRCYFGGKCVVTPENRNRCKSCRFKKCLQQGMAVEAVKMGRIPKVEKERALEEAACLQSNTEYSESVTSLDTAESVSQDLHQGAAPHNLQQRQASQDSQLNPAAQMPLFKPSPQDDSFRPTSQEDGFRPTPQDDCFKPTPQDDCFKPTPQDICFRPTPQEDHCRPTPQDDCFKPTPQDNHFRSTPQDDCFKSTPQDNHFRSTPQDDCFKSTPQDNHFRSTPQDDCFKSTPQDDHFRPAPQNSHQYLISQEDLHQRSGTQNPHKILTLKDRDKNGRLEDTLVRTAGGTGSGLKRCASENSLRDGAAPYLSCIPSNTQSAHDEQPFQLPHKKLKMEHSFVDGSLKGKDSDMYFPENVSTSTSIHSLRSMNFSATGGSEKFSAAEGLEFPSVLSCSDLNVNSTSTRHLVSSRPFVRTKYAQNEVTSISNRNGNMYANNDGSISSESDLFCAEKDKMTKIKTESFKYPSQEDIIAGFESKIFGSEDSSPTVFRGSNIDAGDQQTNISHSKLGSTRDTLNNGSLLDGPLDVGDDSRQDGGSGAGVKDSGSGAGVKDGCRVKSGSYSPGLIKVLFHQVLQEENDGHRARLFRKLARSCSHEVLTSSLELLHSVVSCSASIMAARAISSPDLRAALEVRDYHHDPFTSGTSSSASQCPVTSANSTSEPTFRSASQSSYFREDKPHSQSITNTDPTTAVLDREIDLASFSELDDGFVTPKYQLALEHKSSSSSLPATGLTAGQTWCQAFTPESEQELGHYPQLPLQADHGQLVTTEGQYHSQSLSSAQHHHSQTLPSAQHHHSQSLPSAQNQHSQSLPSAQHHHSQSLSSAQHHHSQSLPSAQHHHSQSLPSAQHQPIAASSCLVDSKPHQRKSAGYKVESSTLSSSHSSVFKEDFFLSPQLVSSESLPELGQHFVGNQQTVQNHSGTHTGQLVPLIHSQSHSQSYSADAVSGQSNNFTQDLQTNSYSFESRAMNNELTQSAKQPESLEPASFREFQACQLTQSAKQPESLEPASFREFQACQLGLQCLSQEPETLHDSSSTRSVVVTSDANPCDKVISIPSYYTDLQMKEAVRSLESCINTIFNTDKKRTLRDKYLKMKREGQLEVPPTVPHYLDVYPLLMQSLPQINKKIISFCQTAPGFSTLDPADQKILLKRAYYDIWMLTSSEYFVDGETYLSITDEIFYVRRHMEQIIGAGPTKTMHMFAEQFNALGLSSLEVAILCCIQLTAPSHDQQTDLKDVKEIQKLNSFYLDLLVAVVTHIHSDSCSRVLVDIFRLMPLLVEINRLQRELIGSFSTTKPPIQADTSTV